MVRDRPQSAATDTYIAFDTTCDDAMQVVVGSNIAQSTDGLVFLTGAHCKLAMFET